MDSEHVRCKCARSADRLLSRVFAAPPSSGCVDSLQRQLTIPVPTATGRCSGIRGSRARKACRAICRLDSRRVLGANSTARGTAPSGGRPEFVDHYHEERPYQGLGNALTRPRPRRSDEARFTVGSGSAACSSFTTARPHSRIGRVFAHFGLRLLTCAGDL